MRRALFVVSLLLVASFPASAHHSTTAEFDVTHRMTLTGTLTKVDWVNPHIVVFMSGKDNTAWKFESNPPAWFRRVGVRARIWRRRSARPSPSREIARRTDRSTGISSEIDVSPTATRSSSWRRARLRHSGSRTMKKQLTVLAAVAVVASLAMAGALQRGRPGPGAGGRAKRQPSRFERHVAVLDRSAAGGDQAAGQRRGDRQRHRRERTPDGGGGSRARCRSRPRRPTSRSCRRR